MNDSQLLIKLRSLQLFMDASKEFPTPGDYIAVAFDSPINYQEVYQRAKLVDFNGAECLLKRRNCKSNTKPLFKEEDDAGYE